MNPAPPMMCGRRQIERVISPETARLRSRALWRDAQGGDYRFRHRSLGFARTLGTVGLLLAVSVIILVPGRAGASSVTTEFGWTGWDGSNVVYPTLYQNDTFLPNNVYATGSSNVSTGYGKVASAVVDALSTEPGYQPVYWFDTNALNGGSSVFRLDLFVSTAGGSQFAPNLAKTAPQYEPGAIATDITYTGLPSQATSVLEGFNQVGTNTTVGNINDAPATTSVGPYVSMAAAALAVGAIVFPEVAIPVEVGAALLDSTGAMGGFTSSGYGLTSSVAGTTYGVGTIAENSLIQNGTFRPSDNPNWGSNVFSQGFEAETDMGPGLLPSVSAGTVKVASTVQLWNTGDPGDYDIGASAQLTYGIEPAVSIGGTLSLYPGGPPASNAQVQLQQIYKGTQTDFDLNTTSTGYWHFFGRPGASYTLVATVSNGLGSTSITDGLPASATSSATVGSNDTSLNYNLDAGLMQGKVTSSSSGKGIASDVTVYDNGQQNAQLVVTGSSGTYSLVIPQGATSSNPFSVLVTATGYTANRWTLSNVPLGSTTTENFALVGSGGGGTGGGGCVAFGTLILTPSGYRPIQSVQRGTPVVEFNLSSGFPVTGALISANVTRVAELLEIDSGRLFLTPTDQPVFIRNSTFEGWLRDPQNLTTSDQLLDPITWNWINVTSLKLVYESSNVYDVVTTGLNDFIADGILLDAKTP